MKKFIKYTLIALLLLVVVIALLPTIAGGFIRDKVTDQLSASMDAHVEVKDFSFGWLSGLDAKGIVIDGRAADAPDIKIGRLEAKPNLMALLGGEIKIEELRAEKVVVRQRGSAPKTKKSSPTKGDGSGRGKSSAKEEAAGEASELPKLAINAVVKDLTIIYDDPAYANPIRVESIQEIRVKVKTGEPVTFTIQDPAISIEGEAKLFDGRKLRTGDEVDISARIKSDNGDLGRFKDALAPWLEMAGGRFTMDELITREGGQWKIVGTFNASNLAFADKFKSGRHRIQSVTLNSDFALDTDSNPSGTLNFELKDAEAKGMEGFDEPVVVSVARLDGVIHPDQKLEVKSATIKGDLVDMDAEGVIDYSGKFFKGNFDLTLRAALDRLAKLSQEPRDLSGDLETKVKLTTAADGRVTLRGETTVMNLRAAPFKEGMPPLSEDRVLLKHDLTMLDDTITLEDIRLDASFAKARATGSLKLGEEDSASTGQININADANLDDIMALVGDLMPGSASGRVRLVGTLNGRPEGLGFDTTLTGNRVDLTHEALGDGPFSLGKIDFRAKGTMNRDDDVLDINSLILNSGVCRLQGSMNQRLGDDEDSSLRLALAGTADLVQLSRPFLDEAMKPSALSQSRVDFAIEQTSNKLVVRKADLQTARTKAQLQGTLVTNEDDTSVGNWTYRIDGFLQDLDALITAFKPGRIAGELHGEGSIVTGEALRFSGKGRASQLNMSGELAGDQTLGAQSVDYDLDFVMSEGLQDLNIRRAELRNAVLEPEDGAALRGDLKVLGQVNADGGFNFSVNGDRMGIRPTDKRQFQSMNSGLVLGLKGRRDEATQAWDVTKLDLTAAGIVATGRMNYRPGKRVVLSTQSQLQPQAFAQNWLALYFDDVDGSGRGQLNLDVDMPLGDDADWAGSTGSLLAKIDQLRIGGLTMDAFDLQGNMTNGVGKLSRGTATVNGGPATLGLDLDMRPEEPILEFSVDARDVNVVEKFQPTIARVIPIFAGIGAKVETKVSLNMKLKGRSFDQDTLLNSLNGTGSFSSAKGSIVGGPLLTTLARFLKIPPRLDFDALQTGITVRDGAVFQEAFNMKGSPLDLQLGGSTAFNGDLNYKLGIRPEPGRIKEWDKFSPILASNGFLPLGLKGHVSSPGLRLPDPAKLIEGAIKSRLDKGISDLLGGKKPSGLSGLLGGGKDGDKKTDGKKKPKDRILEGLGGLLGGKKKDKKTDEKKTDEKKKKKKKKKDILGGLGGLLGGGSN
ncbi:MAG: AsmA-like C-terminal region-containing protein [Planctomycetota bacterium]